MRDGLNTIAEQSVGLPSSLAQINSTLRDEVRKLEDKWTATADKLVETNDRDQNKIRRNLQRVAVEMEGIRLRVATAEATVANFRPADSTSATHTANEIADDAEMSAATVLPAPIPRLVLDLVRHHDTVQPPDNSTEGQADREMPSALPSGAPTVTLSERERHSHELETTTTHPARQAAQPLPRGREPNAEPTIGAPRKKPAVTVARGRGMSGADRMAAIQVASLRAAASS